jgi:3-oxoacyl-[acyl-carrier-protein] synthase-3
MSQPATELGMHLLDRLRQVQANLGVEPVAQDVGVRFADAVDSMGLVEFLALVAGDCAATVGEVERAAGHRFGTVAELAAALDAAGLRPRAVGARAVPAALQPGGESPPAPAQPHGAWLAATAAGLPAARQTAQEINALLGRPAGWLERRAGIHERCVWAGEDVPGAAARTAGDCLDRAGVAAPAVGALLVTSEAPPVLAGLAAALHHRLGLAPGAVALEAGGACTGFLAALWLARRLLPGAGAVLVLSVEAPSRLLSLQPGPAGEAAALFGDATAACVLTNQPAGPDALPLAEVVLQADGSAGQLLQVRQGPGGLALWMEGPALAGRAVGAMAGAVRDLAGRHGLGVTDLGAVVAHGGNGRLPALLARQLGLGVDRVWSEAAHTGNLGSASLPVAWAAHPPPRGPVAWTAVGAGLQWGAALFTPAAL